MPINFFKDIKLAEVCGTFPVDDAVTGIYAFSCRHLESNQALFNDGFPSLILMPEKSDEVHLTHKGSVSVLKPVWVCCGVIQDVHWKIPEALEYILVLRFNPASFFSVFNIDPAVFRNQPVCSFEDLVDQRWMELISEVYQLESIQEKMTFLKETFSDDVLQRTLPPYLQVAVDYIGQKKGNTTVSELLTAMGAKVNYKWLQRNFIKYIGMPPKKYISLQRFIYAYGQYRKEKPEELPDIALNSGYYDYNHFFKDFKQFIGTSPSRYY